MLVLLFPPAILSPIFRHLLLSSLFTHPSSTSTFPPVTSLLLISPKLTLTPAELHDYMGSHGRRLGMPIGEFIAESYIGLCSGEDTILIQDVASDDRTLEISKKRRELFEGLAKLIRSH